MALHCRVVFAFLFLPLARAAWDNRNIQFAKMTGVTYEDEDEDAFTDLRLWTAAIEELLKLAPEASRERLLAGMRLVDKQWDTTFEAYAAAKEAKRSTADVLAPSFPGQDMYADASFTEIVWLCRHVCARSCCAVQAVLCRLYLLAVSTAQDVECKGSSQPMMLYLDSVLHQPLPLTIIKGLPCC
jgi:hypothetical protein